MSNSSIQLENITDYGSNDVLYGRGGLATHHEGNKKFRLIVEGKKKEYSQIQFLQKSEFAMALVKEWRNQVPAGRFLKFDAKKKVWNDVGDKEARKKTSQSLRENKTKHSECNKSKESGSPNKKKKPQVQKRKVSSESQSNLSQQSTSSQSMPALEEQLSTTTGSLENVELPMPEVLQDIQPITSLPRNEINSSTPSISPTPFFPWESSPHPNVQTKPKITHAWDLPKTGPSERQNNRTY